MTREDASSRPSQSRWSTLAVKHSQSALPVIVRATATRTLPFGSLVELEGVPGLATGAGGAAVGEGLEGRIGDLDARKQWFSLLAE
jgi:hypothetical protein